MPVYLDMHLLS